MKKVFLGLYSILLSLSLTLFEQKSHGAAGQPLNASFFQNPAELSLINQMQLIGGNVFITPTLTFTGTTSLGSGKSHSKVNNSLPYLLTAYRLADHFVMGLNITPSAYGHLNWTNQSIVEESSTLTNLAYYRIGAQTSYQFNNQLALGFGVNLHYNKLLELDFVVPAMGNQINKVKGLNHSFDIGLFYKFNQKNNITLGAYTPVNTLGHGTSSLGNTTVDNFSLSVVEAAVAFIGLQHLINDKWFMEERIYWSGWSIEKNVVFINTTTGSSISPAHWKDVWSFQISTRYTILDKVALLGSIIYETNPVPTTTNQIGYPLAACGGLSAGLDLTLQKEFTTQLVYGYGFFMPNAKINNATSMGSISANVQSIALQFIYKL